MSVKSAEEHLWDACSEGRLDLVETLLKSHPDLDVNSAGLDRGDTPLHRACRFGWTHVVQHLLQHLRIRVNEPNAGRGTPFYIACQEGNLQAVKVLLKDQRIDVNAARADDATPFFVACEKGYVEITKLLLEDPRVECNRTKKNDVTPFLIACFRGWHDVVALLLADDRVNISWGDHQGCTPLWFASQNGHLSIVRLMLASGRDVNHRARSASGDNEWSDTTAADMARRNKDLEQEEDEEEAEFQQRHHDCQVIADLLDSFEADELGTRTKLREVPGIREPFIAESFALVVLLSDDFLRLRPPASSSSPTAVNCVRFLVIAQALPMELQMVLSNRVFRSRKDLVLTKHSEPAFRKLSRFFVN